MVRVISKREANLVNTNDAPDWSEVVAISPYPAVFGPVLSYSQLIPLTVPANSTVSFSIPIALSLPIGVFKISTITQQPETVATITITTVLVTDIYVSSSSSELISVVLYSQQESSQIPQATPNIVTPFSALVYGNFHAHGTYIFNNSIIGQVVNYGSETATVYITLAGLYTLANISAVYLYPSEI